MATKCKYGCNNGRVFLEALGTFVDCPDCRNIQKVIHTEQPDGTSLFDKLAIPDAYKDFGVSGRELFSIPGIENFSQSSVNSVANLLEQINKDVYNSAVTKMSVYIYTPREVDIKKFVYGLQKMALEKTLSVTPFISANTLYGIMRAGDYNRIYEQQRDNVPPEQISLIEGYRFFQRTGLSFDDFVHADLCLIKASAGNSDKGAIALAELLGQRAENNLSTYVIGYWASKSFNRFRGMGQLIAPENSRSRLEWLVPFELKPRSADSTVHIEKIIEVETTKSSITAGLSADSLMG